MFANGRIGVVGGDDDDDLDDSSDCFSKLLVPKAVVLFIEY